MSGADDSLKRAADLITIYYTGELIVLPIITYRPKAIETYCSFKISVIFPHHDSGIFFTSQTGNPFEPTTVRSNRSAILVFRNLACFAHKAQLTSLD